MLSPRFIAETLPKELWDRYSDIEHRIIMACARMFKGDDWIETWRRAPFLAEMMLRAEIEKIIYSQWGETRKDLAQAFEDAASKALAGDERVFRRAVKAGLSAAAVPIAESTSLADILAAGFAQAQNVLNLTNTTAVSSTMNLIDTALLRATTGRAFLKASTGNETLQSAINEALNELATKGVTGVVYPGGGRMSLAPFVRMNVQTSVMRTTHEMSFARARDYGSDLIQVSSHAGARPGCFPWQGGVYSLSGKHPKYRALSETSYGQPAGLFGINCRHFHWPWFEFMNEEYSRAQRDPAQSELGISNDELYRQTQEQRYNERQIRRWKYRRDELEKQGLDSSRAAKKVKEWQARQRELVDKTVLTRQYNREKAA